MDTFKPSRVRSGGYLDLAAATGGLIVTAVGWTMVLAVMTSVWTAWPNSMVWLPIGYLIGALGVSLFLLAASKEHSRGTPRSVAVIVLVSLAGLLAYSFLGPFGPPDPFGPPERPTPREMVESLGYMFAIPAFIALQIGLVSVARGHPDSQYRSISRIVAAIYAVLIVTSIGQQVAIQLDHMING
jgi:hypothetical protein